MTFSYQLIKAMTKSEKETRQQLYVFVEEKKLGETRRNSRQQRAHTLTHRHDLSLSSYKHDTYTALLVLNSGR